MTKDIWVVQPYVPAYRVPFFEALISRSRQENIDVHVVAGMPRGDQAMRSDAARPEWLHQRGALSIPIGSRRLTVSSSRELWGRADGVVVPLMGSSIDAMLATALPRQLKVGVWGHVGPYTSPANRIDASVERWQMRRADRIFAYTEGGTRFAIQAGVDPAKITTVMNSIETDRLERDLASVTDEEVRALRMSVGLRPDEPYIAFLGGLDASKRIDLLAEALDVLHARGSRVRILVAGTGVAGDLLAPAEERGQVRRIGYQDGRHKAVLLRGASSIANPGRIGLVAVDALAAGVPILSVRWAFHAPEVEYLKEGESLFLAADSPHAYAELLDDADIRETQGVRVRAWNYPSLEDMVENFAAGLRAMVDS